MTRNWIAKPWIRAIFTNRLVLYGVLMLVETQFFTINLLNTHLRHPTDGWELRIGAIDDHLTPNGLWLIPYFVGFFFASLIPLWAVFYMPNKVYRQFVCAVILALLCSYVLYILFPTYVVKPSPDRVLGDDMFARALRRTYEADLAISSHNAAPSQHVFYALLNMCFMIRYRPRPRVFGFWLALAALICVSTLATMRHNSPDLMSGYLVAVAAYYGGVYLGGHITDELGDEDDPVMVPGAVGRLHRRLRAYHRQSSGRRQRQRMRADAT